MSTQYVIRPTFKELVGKILKSNKIKKAKTDPLPLPQDIKELEERLEAKNLLGIYSSLTNSTLQNSVKSFAGKNFSEFKENLSQKKSLEFITPNPPKYLPVLCGVPLFCPEAVIVAELTVQTIYPELISNSAHF